MLRAIVAVSRLHLGVAAPSGDGDAMRMLVRGTGPFTTDMGEAVMDEVGDESIDDSVVALSTFLPSGHQPEMPQESELVTHGGHREAEGVREIPNAKLFVSKSVHQTKP